MTSPVLSNVRQIVDFLETTCKNLSPTRENPKIWREFKHQHYNSNCCYLARFHSHTNVAVLFGSDFAAQIVVILACGRLDIIFPSPPVNVDRMLESTRERLEKALTDTHLAARCERFTVICCGTFHEFSSVVR